MAWILLYALSALKSGTWLPPWHATHFAVKMGIISAEKLRVSPGSGGGSGAGFTSKSYWQEAKKRVATNRTNNEEL
ncbi:MAG: hypothetical protein CVT99_08405 [Bacteroidetes bacterium HGW-Bacteroidetes-16]|nr:MAG: hypothetical protein CVT99_08405 [Bacteroidetes bacterium HGW-Bacteroidetes-16]